MDRQQQRNLWHVVLFVLAGGAILYGFDGGWALGMPAHLTGLILLLFAIAGLCGVNIWAGGPLDPRNDPPPPDRGPERRLPRRWAKPNPTEERARKVAPEAKPTEPADDRVLCPECGFRYLKIVGRCPKCVRP